MFFFSAMLLILIMFGIVMVSFQGILGNAAGGFGTLMVGPLAVIIALLPECEVLGSEGSKSVDATTIDNHAARRIEHRDRAARARF